MAIFIFFIFYWIAAGILLLIGIVQAFNKEKRKQGIQILIGAVVMLIIGAGVCGAMLSGLGNMH